MPAPRHLRWGLRVRITLIATTVVLVVLVTASIALLIAQRSVLTDSVDEVLVRHSSAVALQLGQQPRQGGGEPVVLAAQGDDESFAFVLDSSGAVVAATPGAPDDGLSRSTGYWPRYESVQVGQQLFRILVIRADETPLVIVTGTPLDDVEESVTALSRGLSATVPLASALLGVMVWLIVGRVLRPVEDLRKRVASITARNLNARLPRPAGQDEIARLAATMNDMLDRLEESSKLQRAFIADASHELRSPLARIRSELEVDLAHPELADYPATRLSALAELDGLQRLIDDLLMLARGEGNDARTRGEIVDLDDLVFQERDHLKATSGITADVSGVTGAQARGNAGQLARLMRNLLDNAARHGRPPIAVSVREGPDGAELVVDDGGSGIASELRDRAFERFTRADEARAGGGSGLGLAIARELARAHGGTIEIGSNPVGGARVTVRLPRVTV